MESRAVLLLLVVYFCGNACFVIEVLPKIPFDYLPMCGLVTMQEIGKGSKQIKYMVSSTQLSWNEARDECKTKGMMLASPTTDNEIDWLIISLYKHDLAPVDAETGYWIGSHRLSGNDPWIWEFNGQKQSASGWLTHVPNGYDGKDCTELTRESKDLQDKDNSGVKFRSIGFNNYNCSGLRRYICEPVKNMETYETTRGSSRGPPCKFSQNGTEGNSVERKKLLQELDALFPKPERT